MKTYEECAMGILQKAQQRRSAYQKRQKLVRYWVSAAACLLIAAVCAGPGAESPLPGQEVFPFGPAPQGGQYGEMTPEQETAEEDVVFINSLEEEEKKEAVLADQESACVPLPMEQWMTHFGVDIRPAELPLGLREQGYAGWIQLDGSGAVLADRLTITYEEVDKALRASAGGPAAWLTVSAATGGPPLEADHVWPEDPVESTLSGIAVTIGFQRISEEYGEYAALFSADGLRVSVVAQNLSQQDFLQILSSVLARFSAGA